MSAGVLSERQLSAINERATVGVGAVTADVLELIDSNREANARIAQLEGLLERLQKAVDALAKQELAP